MIRPKLYGTREKCGGGQASNPPWYRIPHTEYKMELDAFSKAQGKTLEGQKEYFDYLAESYDEKLSDIEKISHSLDPNGSEDFNALLSVLEERQATILNR